MKLYSATISISKKFKNKRIWPKFNNETQYHTKHTHKQV